MSIGLSGGGDSFTCVGNVAPPMPQIPPFKTRSLIASASAARQSHSTFAPSAHASSSPSRSIRTLGTVCPSGWIAVPRRVTAPETGA